MEEKNIGAVSVKGWNRRGFLGTAGSAASGWLVGPRSRPEAPSPPQGSSRLRLAGRSLTELRQHFFDELFQVCLPFWDQHGVDHAYGGIMCSLDYDGTRTSTDKLMWFQGRAIWVYSFLYNHFGRDPRHLEIAAKTKHFVLAHGLQPDGWLAESLSREGQVLKPFEGDVYGMYFVAEGLQEYAIAAEDSEAFQMALDMVQRLFEYIEEPSFRYPGQGEPGRRVQGLWMVNLRIATQILRRRDEPSLARIAGRCVDAIINRHYNPEIGLNNEVLNHDFSRPEGEDTKSLLGHSVETLWMVMDEADRRKDAALWQTCADRIRRHLEVGWDPVFGGFAQWINVDQGCYQWPVEQPVGTDLEFRSIGEYSYMKPLWALNEIQIAALYVFERNQAEWAARFFGMAEEVTAEKYRKKAYGLPGYMLFADRTMTHQLHVARQDNYHPPRQFMLNLLTLDRMIRQSEG